MKHLSLPEHISNRASNSKYNERFSESLYLNDSYINRLSLEAELSGHKGCVNCLEWTRDGLLLASGSDDLTVRIWCPQRRKQISEISTGHRSNIFSVKFIEDTNNSLIASSAADAQVRVHNVEKGDTVNTFACHRYRVKRLCTSKVSPSLIWSAGEDGTVRMLDLRENHTCSSSRSCKNVCINLNGENISNGNQPSEAKCLAISPSRPYIAVGSSDEYVRLFDMRKLRVCGETFVAAFGPMRAYDPSAFYCVPGHIANQDLGISKKNGRTTRMGFSSFRTVSSTFVTFNESGSELLVNLGSEQIYLYDMMTYMHSFKYSFPETRYKFLDTVKKISNKKDENECDSRNGECAVSDIGATSILANLTLNDNTKCTTKIIDEWTTLKERANEFFREEKYMNAVSCYSRLLQMTSYNAHIIYANRALALMKRKWSGDVYAALLDLRKSIEYDPLYGKAHLRLIKCMLEFEWVEEAYHWSLLLQKHVDAMKCDESFTRLHHELSELREKRDYKDSNRGMTNSESSSPSGPSVPSASHHITQQELLQQQKAMDFKGRFCGHCNAATDIKEANFFGNGDGQYIVAGSDDGSFFIWDKYTTNLLRVMIGDESIVNCLQPNPRLCMLATSGIDDTIKLWSPGRTNVENPHLRTDLTSVASSNQKRLHQDPIETFFSLNFTTMSHRFASSAHSSDDEGAGSTDEAAAPDTCRTS
ncbi:WD and tetratricopeptide repeats protein 1-like [Symsagittifera roscoffensis]|uniref:WD and tetratricopeptide repeats protein 1-like n=1 Tax=Symsagittifera roscoffensis TaxID=84072 RepID=UPI00307B94D4